MPAPVQICDMACKMIISIKSQVSSAFIHQSRFIIHIPVADNNTTELMVYLNFLINSSVEAQGKKVYPYNPDTCSGNALPL